MGMVSGFWNSYSCAFAPEGSIAEADGGEAQMFLLLRIFI
jgi:hypothetical protein